MNNKTVTAAITALKDLISIAEEERFSPHSLGIAFRNSIANMRIVLTLVEGEPVSLDQQQEKTDAERT